MYVKILYFYDGTQKCEIYMERKKKELSTRYPTPGGGRL